MADMISMAALLDEFHSLCGPQTGDGWDNMGVRNLIMRQKAVDAVPVVRCRDCKYYDRRCFTCENDVLLIKIDDCGCHPPFRVDDDWFCADGERSESE